MSKAQVFENATWTVASRPAVTSSAIAKIFASDGVYRVTVAGNGLVLLGRSHIPLKAQVAAVASVVILLPATFISQLPVFVLGLLLLLIRKQDVTRLRVRSADNEASSVIVDGAASEQIAACLDAIGRRSHDLT